MGDRSEAGRNRDFEKVQERVASELLEPEFEADSIKDLFGALNKDGGWPGIDYEDVSRTGFKHTEHLERLTKLSIAFVKPGSPFHGDGGLGEVVFSAFDFWLEHDFIADNWYHNEISIPRYMVRILLILKPVLDEHRRKEGLEIVRRASWEAYGRRQHADKMRIAGVIGERALLEDDVDLFAEAMDAMAGEIRIGHSGDIKQLVHGRGMQADFSFHHRWTAEKLTTSYGMSYVRNFAEWHGRVRGTRYSFPVERVDLLIEYYLEGVSRSLAHGKYPDPGSTGRHITVKSAMNPWGPEYLEALADASEYRRAELEELIEVRLGEREPEYSYNKFFWNSEYMAHQRPGYFASVRMYSTRNHNTERAHNRGGLKSHHLSDGSNFLTRTGGEYTDIFPVFDWMKIPGTTVLQKSELPPAEEIQKRGLTGFAGGVSDGEYGSAAFDFESPHDPLKARKSWFFFDGEYVCLGAGISSGAEEPVATTAAQHLLSGEVFAGSEGRRRILGVGEHGPEELCWVWHDGVGYVFLDSEKVKVSTGSKSGNWRDINEGQGYEEAREEVFIVWLDHGRAPHDAAYEYIVLPGASAEETESYMNNPCVEILSNTRKLQAVRHAKLNLTQAVFYEAGELDAGGGLKLRTESPCMVIVRQKDGRILEIAVSDPSRGQDQLRLELTHRFIGEGPGWKSFWDEESGRSIVQLNLARGEYAGKTLRMALEQEQLERTVLESRVVVCRRDAAEMLGRQGVLSEVALRDQSWSVRRAAVMNLRDQEVLEKVVFNDSQLEVRGAAIGNLTDDSVLTRVAAEEEDASLRLAAVNALKDEEALAAAALSQGASHVTRTALSRITDRVLLSETAEKIFGARVERMDFEVSIDGDLSEWYGREYIEMAADSEGREARARLYTGWDDENLYMAVLVEDESHFNEREGPDIWNGDSLQVAVDPWKDAAFNLGFALASGSVQAHQWAGPETALLNEGEYSVARDEEAGETYYEVKLPFARLNIEPVEGEVFGFNAVVFEDGDGKGFDYWIEVTPGLAGGWDPREFKLFVLRD